MSSLAGVFKHGDYEDTTIGGANQVGEAQENSKLRTSHNENGRDAKRISPVHALQLKL